MEELETYETNVLMLSSMVPIWPPIKALRTQGNKWNTLTHLNLIAAENSMYTPLTRALRKGDPIPSGTVLKRIHSDCGLHVILPDAGDQQRSWKHLNDLAPHGETWMSQEYVDSLDKVGEWRVFVIGGQILSVVHTHNKEPRWGAKAVRSFMTLEEVE